MTREATVKLARTAWIALLLYVLGKGFVAMAIGWIADLLVFVFAVVTVLIALYCLARMRVHGTRGILVHGLTAFLLGALLLAIWIPNFLSSRERAANRDPNRAAVTVHVSRDGTIRMNGSVISLEALKPELRRVAAAGGVLRYSRDDPQRDPHPNAMAVIAAAAETNIAIEMPQAGGP